MQLELVTFEQAKLLKEAGFDWDVNYYYWKTPGGYWDGDYTPDASNQNTLPHTISRPTIALALKWLREVRKIHATIEPAFNFSRWFVAIHNADEMVWERIRPSFHTHDLAESAALTHALNLIK
jgi:hypothetical protein